MEMDLKNKLEYKMTRPIRCSGTVSFTGAEEDTAATRVTDEDRLL